MERLINQGAHVRVLLSRFSGVSRIARLPVEFACGDVASATDVDRAAEGCRFILHCAYGSRGTLQERRAVSVEGTRNILQAGRKHQAQRIVHLSSLMVYGRTADGDLTEESPHNLMNNDRAETKQAAERLAQEAGEQGLPVVILQPTAVYGPFSGVWTRNVIDQLDTGLVILVNGGDGLCNCVYIDDVVDSILLALTNEEAVGETFLISGDEPVTWRIRLPPRGRSVWRCEKERESPAAVQFLMKAGRVHRSCERKHQGDRRRGWLPGTAVRAVRRIVW